MKTVKRSKILKSQLVAELSEQTTISKIQCDFMYETLLDIVKQHLLDEQEVEFKGLGRFYFLKQKVRMSNMTNEVIVPHKQLKFKVADRLGRTIRVNSREY